MVWIHGGGLRTLAGPDYDGEELARKGAAVVTINYRLGVRWVKSNIAAFGGDTNRVTIFSESACSWSVNYLTAIPLARGLFHRAIGRAGRVRAGS